MAGTVLSDASPLIALARVGGLAWLPALFGAVWVPREVASEVLGPRGFAEEKPIAQALKQGWLKRCRATPIQPALPDLDEGEAACIRWALAWRHKGPGLILMDERLGRVIAQEHGLKVAGTAALIGMAKSQGLIPSARRVFETLHASDFRIAPDVIHTVLKRVGESGSAA